MNDTGGNERYRALRKLALVLVAAPVVVGVVLYLLLGTADGGMDGPPAWLLLGQVVFAVAILALVEAVGYRAKPAEIGESDVVGNASVLAFQSAMLLRFALCETLMIVSVALSFVATPHTFLNYPLGGLLSLALMVFEVLPNRRSVARTQAALESRGRPSYLHEALGLGG